MYTFFKKISFKTAVVLVLTVSLAVLVPLVARAEWFEPESSPATEQFSPPITAGPENQAKKGYLELNPTYLPTPDSSLIFDPQRPLHVYGEGVYFATPTTYSDVLTVDTDTLYAHAWHDWVGIGTTSITDGYKLEIDSGTVRVGSTAAPVPGRAVSAYSNDGVGIYADAGTTAEAGVYGLRLLGNGQAVRGVSQDNAGVRGESSDGYGIYATTESSINAAVYGANDSKGWAGYFDGRLAVNADLVSRQFLRSRPQRSLISFTMGELVGYYQITVYDVSSLHGAITYDGSNIWVSNKYPESQGGVNFDHNIFKIRASDGEVIGRYNLASRSLMDLAFDGGAIWAVSAGSSGDTSVVKINSKNGTELCSGDTKGTGLHWGEDPSYLTVSTEDGQIFIWAANAGEGDPSYGGDLTKFDDNCVQQDIYPVGETGSGDELNRILDDPNRYNNPALPNQRVQPSDILFADGAIWTILENVSDFNLIKIDPTAADPDNAVTARYETGLSSPRKFVFDGVYFWILGNGKVVTKVRADDGQIAETFTLGYDVNSLAFDGSYIWIVGNTVGNTVYDGRIFRINVATGEVVEDYGWPTNFANNRILFDGSYLWMLSSCDDTNCAGGAANPLRLTKIFSGTGLGHIDVGAAVSVYGAYGICSITQAQSCSFDWQCPGGETCIGGHGAQTGNINISGSAEISGDTLVGGNLKGENNQWGGNDDTQNISGGAAACADGQFIKGITIDAAGQISEIICREL